MANEPKKVRQRRSMLQIPGVQTILSSLLCIVLGLLVGFVVLLLIDHGVIEKTGNLNAIDAILVIIKNFWKYGSSTAQMKYLGNTLVETAPLLMCGLSVLFAYKVGLSNIGAAGQYGRAARVRRCTVHWRNMPWYVCLLAAALAGALLACFSGALKAFCNVNEVISCILLNWISLYAVNSLLSLVKDSNTPYTVKLSVGNPSALMPSLGLEKLFSNNRHVTIAIPLAIVIAVLDLVLLQQNEAGPRELKATGLNKNAAKYCGMREKQNLILTMGIAGALAGIGAGFMFLSGFEEWAVAQSAVPAMGFNGIAAAFLGGLHPIGTIFASFFIQHITFGGAYVDRAIYSSQISDLISAVIIYMCGFVLFFRQVMTRLAERKAEANLRKEANLK
ncbi:MAG: ABC transporter permease [Christensenellales bacterium]